MVKRRIPSIRLLVAVWIIEPIRILLNYLSETFLVFRTVLSKGCRDKKTLLTRQRLKGRALFIKIFNRRIGYDTIFGFRIKIIDYLDFLTIFEEIFVRKIYYFETEVKYPLIIDCGAHIGMATLFFKKLYPDSRIIAFEPHKKTFDVLQYNIENNNLKNVTLLDKAVYNHRGVIDLYYCDDLITGSRLSLKMSVIPGRMPEAKSSKVNSALLSDYINEPVDFLKMDIQGAEYAVVQELNRREKLGLIKEMVIEYHHRIKQEIGDLPKILKLLEGSGFVYKISASCKNLLNKGPYQDIIIFAYRKR